MVKIELNDYEKEAVLFLADRYHQGGKRFAETEFPRYEKVGQQAVYDAIG